MTENTATQNTAPLGAAPGKLSDSRPPTMNADERTTLLAFLDYLREAVIAKVDGLGDEDARRPGVASGTSLLWLVRHLTVVEHNWFEWAYGGLGEQGPVDSEAAVPADLTVAAAVAEKAPTTRPASSTRDSTRTTTASRTPMTESVSISHPGRENSGKSTAASQMGEP